MAQVIPKGRRCFPHMLRVIGSITVLGMVSFAPMISADASTDAPIPNVTFYPGRNVIVHVTTPQVTIEIVTPSGASRIYVNNHNVLSDPIGFGEISKLFKVKLGKNTFRIRILTLSGGSTRGTIPVYRTVPTRVKAVTLAKTGDAPRLLYFYVGITMLLAGTFVRLIRRAKRVPRVRGT